MSKPSLVELVDELLLRMDQYDPYHARRDSIIALIADQAQEAYKRGYIDGSIEQLTKKETTL